MHLGPTPWASLLILLSSLTTILAIPPPHLERDLLLREPPTSDAHHSLLKRTYNILGHNQFQKKVLKKAFRDALTLAHLASDSPHVPEPLRRRIALNYFRPEEYDTVKEVFRNLLAGRPTKGGDPRLSALDVDIVDAAGLCIRSSPKGDGTDLHAGVTYRVGAAAPVMTVCPGFWITVQRVVGPTCGNVGTVVSQVMKFPGGTILHEFLYVRRNLPFLVRGGWICTGIGYADCV